MHINCSGIEGGKNLPPLPDFIVLRNSILSSICILYRKEGDFHLTNMVGSCINNLNFILILTRFYFLICTAHNFFPKLYQEVIKSSVKSGNACYHSVQNLCLPDCYTEIERWRFAELYFCLFCIGVKHFHLHWGSNVGWGCLRIGCRGEYLGLRRMR